MKAMKSNGKNGRNGAQNHELLKCDLPPDEALRRAMMVKPPKDWKRTKTKKVLSR
jgi:hypothetical protein